MNIIMELFMWKIMSRKTKNLSFDSVLLSRSHRSNFYFLQEDVPESGAAVHGHQPVSSLPGTTALTGS